MFFLTDCNKFDKVTAFCMKSRHSDVTKCYVTFDIISRPRSVLMQIFQTSVLLKQLIWLCWTMVMFICAFVFPLVIPIQVLKNKTTRYFYNNWTGTWTAKQVVVVNSEKELFFLLRLKEENIVYIFMRSEVESK